VQNRENNYKISHTKKLLASKNIIFRGAPGTGKSFLAKQIAADIISGGAHTDYQRLTPEEKKQVEFVQFHPSYDYSDFVEGLRPVKNGSGIDFDLRSGIFKAFCEKAKKSVVSFDDAWSLLLENAKQNNDLIDIERERSSQQLKWNEKNQKFYGTTGSLIYQWADYESCKKTYEDVFESNSNSGSNQQTKNNSLGIVNLLKEKYNLGKKDNFVFIIDEINRGEISKIFGELFYSIEPSKRGKAGEIATQYANMHPKDEELFYIPENVYIIGTMNDIDRSVDSFDFAMRRRFKFIEITAKDSQAMLEGKPFKDESIARMDRLNKSIEDEAKLNSNYFIGASYFMDIKEVDDFEELWNDNLQPLLQEYIVGSYGADKTIEKLKLAYDDKADNKQKDNNADDGAKDDESNKNNG
jgi:5-methylcytosine-specific restriction endonuclease McrBC GTP-binding regulatory subunit McrB